MSYKVIDVSQFNGKIDWRKVKDAGYNYAVIRVGYRGYGSAGTIVLDGMLIDNLFYAKNAGVNIGAYFVSQAVNEAEAVAEADRTIAEVKAYKLNLPVFIDSETAAPGYTSGLTSTQVAFGVAGTKGRGDKLTSAQRTKTVVAFCKRVKELGYSAGVYASESWFKSNLDSAQLQGYALWVAKYSSTKPTTKNYIGWQYTDKGKVDGISGYVDISDFTYNSVQQSVTVETAKNPVVKIQRWGTYLADIEHIAYIPMNGATGETVSAAAKRVKWNGRAPDAICNAELFDMKTFAPVSGCTGHITPTHGFAFRKGVLPVFSYSNNTNEADWIGSYPVLVRDGKNVVKATPAGLEGKKARTALALNNLVFSFVYVPAYEGATLEEFADAIVAAGFHTAINLDGGGSTAVITPFVAYDQGRKVRGKVALWERGGKGNKLTR